MDAPIDMSALDQLRDVILPSDPGFWPPAIGWWILLALIVVAPLAFIYCRRLFQSYQVQQHAKKDISGLAGLEATQVAVRLSIHMRKMAITRFPNESVAGLTDERWLEFLDRSGDTDQFTCGPGRLLITAPYERHGASDTDSLLEVCMNWVKHTR